jgi:hypothetical protein
LLARGADDVSPVSTVVYVDATLFADRLWRERENEIAELEWPVVQAGNNLGIICSNGINGWQRIALKRIRDVLKRIEKGDEVPLLESVETAFNRAYLRHPRIAAANGRGKEFDEAAARALTLDAENCRERIEPARTSIGSGTN